MNHEEPNIQPTPKQTAEAVLGRMLAKDAFTKWLGIKVDEVDAGYCKLHFIIRPEMLNGFGTLHGGVSFAAADSALAFACNSYGRLSVALSVTIDYIEPGKEGDILTVEAQEVSLKRKISHYSISIKNQREELVAQFKGTAYRTEKPI
jgi:acyl-CoA thioesterase